MKSPFEKKFCGKSPLKELTAKQEANLPEALKTAIEASPTNYGSPLEQEKSPGNVGYYNPEFEPHPSEKLPTRRENQAELDAAEFGLDLARIDRNWQNLPSGPEKTAKAKEAYERRKPYFDADAKMRKQKRKDYKTILKAGATIFKNM